MSSYLHGTWCPGFEMLYPASCLLPRYLSELEYCSGPEHGDKLRYRQNFYAIVSDAWFAFKADDQATLDVRVIFSHAS